MTSQFPSAQDNLNTSKQNSTEMDTDHPGHHNAVAAAVNAVQDYLLNDLGIIRESDDTLTFEIPDSNKAARFKYTGTSFFVTMLRILEGGDPETDEQSTFFNLAPPVADHRVGINFFNTDLNLSEGSRVRWFSIQAHGVEDPISEDAPEDDITFYVKGASTEENYVKAFQVHHSETRLAAGKGYLDISGYVPGVNSGVRIKGNLVQRDIGPPGPFNIGFSNFGKFQHMWLIGSIFTGDEQSNANMGDGGLTLQQGGADNEILAFKSTDINTNNGVAENDNWASFKKWSGLAGGLHMYGFASAGGGIGIVLNPIATSNLTAKSTSATAAMHIRAQIENGAGGVGPMGSDANLLTIATSGTTRHVFDNEGTYHGDEVTATFDAFDDLALAAELEHTLTNMDAFMSPNKRRRLEELGFVGKNSWHVEGGQLRAMVNNTKRAQLHHGAILALGRAMYAVCEELGITEKVQARLGHNPGMLAF